MFCLVCVSFHVLVRHFRGFGFYTFAHPKFSASFLVHGSTIVLSLQKLCEKTSRFYCYSRCGFKLNVEFLLVCKFDIVSFGVFS